MPSDRVLNYWLASLYIAGMAHSLSPECTPLKHEYDACFNTWFEGYLEPAIANANTKSSPQAHRIEYSKQKKEEYDRKCGSIWVRYKDCVQVSLSSYCRQRSIPRLLEFDILFKTLTFHILLVTESCHRERSGRATW